MADERIANAYSANAEFWIRVVREDRDPFRTRLTDPALLDMIGDCAGQVVLDAGCGEGYFARELVRRGARQVHGVDTCPEFVVAARTHPDHDPAATTYRVADVADLPLAGASVDLVVANRLPHGIDEPGRRFHEFARVLKPSGRLILLGMHPCFYVSRAERAAPGGLSLDSYFGTRTVEQRFEVQGELSPAASVQQFYSLETYFAFLADAGFAVTALREPHPTQAERDSDPWWNKNFTRPLFLLLECRPYRSPRAAG
ncbi:class I SAM-dependent methyltransferase [Nocardia flavorosea]|uniref:class I SAM-dependent methyltransferase n=1 Tax=Nocardia flavorosea TaxID=53429 RepID=UPI001894E1DB|nr:class I SAM-dependent methyltransferase [Nocardia flavorosea]MBF6351466.1 class I SAM-dependent methyltransferase [Nocardia flavorosea]